MFHAEQYTKYVGVEGGRITCCSLLGHRTGLSLGTGVVHSGIEAAEVFNGPFDQVAHFVILTDIRSNKLSLYAKGTQFGDQCPTGFVMSSGDYDVGTLASESQGAGATNTSQGAGDQDNGRGVHSCHPFQLHGAGDNDVHGLETRFAQRNDFCVGLAVEYRLHGVCRWKVHHQTGVVFGVTDHSSLSFDAADNFAPAIDQQRYRPLHVLLGCRHLLRIKSSGYDNGDPGGHLSVPLIGWEISNRLNLSNWVEVSATHWHSGS